MAQRAVTIVAAALVAGLILAPLGAVIWRSGGLGTLGPAEFAALRFTVTQALLSAFFSVLLAIPTARALSRRRFRGRSALITVLGAPFILPTIVAVLGLLAAFGQSGVLAKLLGLFGLPAPQIYGLHGVVLAHVFFNLPLATRLILQGWLSVPAERFRLAASLGLGDRDIARTIEWPMLRAIVPGAFAVIFVVCLSSFAVALTLGGGPKATTLELAVYQAIRFDFDLGRAATLGLVQLALALTAGTLALWLSGARGAAPALDRQLPRWDGQGAFVRAQDAISIVIASLFLLLPLTMIVLRGVGGLADLPAVVWQSAGHSLMVALGSTALCLMLAMPLATRRSEPLALIGIALSPLVLGTGLFLLVLPFASPFTLALPVTALVNALMSLPFAVHALRPEADAVRRDYGRLSAALGLKGWAWVRWVYLPRVRRPLGFGAGLTAALSMGDLGVIALFADPDRATLPLQIYRLMGAYRMEQAGAAALLLLILSLGLFWLFDRGGRIGADT